MKTPFRWTLAALVAIAAAPPAADAAFLQELGSPFATGSVPYGLVTADFNKDGRLDIVGINGQSGNATLLVRQPGGGFAAEGSTPVAAGANFGAVADFNRDGWPDFAVSGFDNGGTATVHLRNPAGGFVPAPGGAITTGPLGAIAAADFNGDGLVDLAVGQASANAVQIFQQRVDGTFTAEGAAIATGAAPRYIAVADFDGDGRHDLAVTNSYGQSVTILLGRPGGGLVEEPGSPVAVGLYPWIVAAADFNGDGRPDLAVANNGADSVSLLERNPGGGFTLTANVPVPGGPVGVAPADFNRDGRLDLAVSSVNTNTVSVLLRQPDGSLTLDAGSPLPVGARPYEVVAADFNLDGKPDLAAVNNAAGNVSVLLNTTPDPAPPPAPPPPAPPTPSVSARLALSWTVSKTHVKLNAVTLRDLPVGGATVRVYCKPCKVSQTIRTTKRTLTLSKLRNKKLKRRATFTVTISKPGFNGLTFTRKVKNYGRSRSALRRAVKAPFSETRRCVPAVAPTKRC